MRFNFQGLSCSAFSMLQIIISPFLSQLVITLFCASRPMIPSLFPSSSLRHFPVFNSQILTSSPPRAYFIKVTTTVDSDILTKFQMSIPKITFHKQTFLTYTN